MSDDDTRTVAIVDTILQKDTVMQLDPGDLLVVRTEPGTDVMAVANQLQRILPNVQVMVCHSGVELAIVKAPRVEHFVESLRRIADGLEL